MKASPSVTVDMTQRIVVTLGALLLWRMSSYIPVPGIDHGAQSLLMQGALARMSVGAIGIVPWLSVVMLAELAALLLPSRATASFTRHGHANPFALPILVVSLAIALLQGLGIATALEHVRGLVLEPGSLFRFTTAVTMAVGAAITIAVAHPIQKYGVGWGFWVLWAAQAMADLGNSALQLVAALSQGILGPETVFAVAAVPIAAMAAVIVLLEARHKAGLASAAPVVWPIHLYAVVIPWIGVLLGILAEPLVGHGQHALLLPTHPLGMAAMVVAIVGFVWLSTRGENQLGLTAVSALVLAAIAAVTTIALDVLNFALMPGGQAVVVAAVGHTLVRQYFMKPETSAP